MFVEIEKIRKNGQSVKKAVDGDIEVSLFVDEDFGSLPVHGLLTSEMPCTMADPEMNVVSNPYLRALLSHEIAVGSDLEYHRLLKETLEQAIFLVMGTSRKKIDDVMERVAVQGNLSLGAVKSGKGTFLAAFTDWDALVRWKQMMRNEHAYSLALPFKDVARLLGKAYAGIVINPFGPDGFAMTPDQIDELGENNNEYQ